ncbi:MAG: S8 family serine peptidase [Acidimicrobiales bacterium]
MHARAVLVTLASTGLALVGLSSSLAAAGPPGPSKVRASDRVVGVLPLLGSVGRAVGAGYTPARIHANYDMGRLYAAGLDGEGETIGIVDVYGSPTIKADLASFDSMFHLAAPPSFEVVRPAGAVPKFNRAVGEMVDWAAETTLDVEWAHAMAPGARIVLAETGVDEVEGTSGFPQIVKAEKYLIAHEHVAVISQSFGATEETFPSKISLLALRGAYVEADRHDVTVLAGSGDWGATGPRLESGYYTRRVTSWPATDPLVTAIGGTLIRTDGAGHPSAPPQVWNEGGTDPAASGGGVSSVFARPAWQHSVASIVGSHRGMPDISMDAACASAGDVVWSFLGGEELVSQCGTSLATPMFAGLVAIADQLAGHHLGLINPRLYKLGAEHAPGLVDITRGNNTVEFVEGGTTHVRVGYRARKGYDLASGWGTVDAAKFVPELAGKPIPS